MNIGNISNYFLKIYDYCCKSTYDFLSIKNYPKKLIFSNKKYNLDFYNIKECFSIGSYGQIIIPMQSGSSISIFDESFLGNGPYEEKEKQIKSNIDILELSLIYLDEAVPVYHYDSFNFGHGVMEVLPKILILEEYGYKGSYIVNKTKFIPQFFALFNIDPKRICYSGTDKNYFVKNLIMTPNYFGVDLIENIDLLKYIRNRLLDATGSIQGNSHVYIKRLEPRLIINEDELLDILRPYDFNVIIPEEYSVKEQIKLMSNVSFSIMPHGAACALICAQKLGSTFMELFSRAYVKYYHDAIIKAFNLNYVPFVEFGYDPINLSERDANRCNIKIHAPTLSVLVSNMFNKKCFFG